MEHFVQMNTSDFLLEHGIKPSFQRIKIFDYLKSTKSHPTVDEIHKHLVKEIPTLSKTTVYNTLNLFIEKGIAIIVMIEENEARYDADTSVHGHFKCNNCGNVYDFHINDLAFNTNELENFKIQEKHLYFKGICENCLFDS